VPPSARWQRACPLDLETICLKCLRKAGGRQLCVGPRELADESEVRYRRVSQSWRDGSWSGITS